MRIRVLGAGIIGLACADELAARHHDVEVVDPAPGTGASLAAAGMLSPSSEVWHGEKAILRLGLASLALWPAWAARLDVPLETTAGTLLVGRDAGDLQDVARQAALLADEGIDIGVLGASEVRRVEPALGSRVAGGAFLPHDPSVDPRAVLAALRERVPVVATPTGAPDVTVVATGARLPEPWTSLVRGVRGEILRAQSDNPPGHTIRGWVHGTPVYVVPRRGGEVVVGATSEEHDEPPVPTLGGVARLLEAALELVPGLDRAELTEVLARDRPATADNLPLVGPTHDPAVVLAAGHYRHGVLLAPLTARLLADHLDGAAPEPALDPRRFLLHPSKGQVS